MTRDATLDAFGTSQKTDDDPEDPNDSDESSESNETSEEEGGGEEEEGREEEERARAVAVTTDWTPAGARCAACGATVERRWQHGESLVCPDCKDWRER